MSVGELSSRSLTPLSSLSSDFDPVVLEFPWSDVTLISCDKSRFRVNRVVLSLASTFFAGMFALPPGPSASSKDSEIDMVERSSVLETLLCYIYPTSRKPEISDVTEAVTLIQTARKLDLPAAETEIVTRVEKLLACYSNPLEAWALAIRCGAETARKAAMLRLLVLSDSEMAEATEQAGVDLAWPSALDYYKLLKWRAAALQAAKAVDTSCISETCEFRRSNSVAQLVRTAIKEQNPFELVASANSLVQTYAHMVKSLCSCSRCKSEPHPSRISEMKELVGRIEAVLNHYKALDPYIRAQSSA